MEGNMMAEAPELVLAIIMIHKYSIVTRELGVVPGSILYSVLIFVDPEGVVSGGITVISWDEVVTIGMTLASESITSLDIMI
jgi:hypothetical protein